MITKDVKEKIREIWPNLSIKAFEPEYPHVPTRGELDAALAKSHIDLFQFRQDFECNHFALMLHADIVKQCYERKQPTWPFGQCFGMVENFLGLQFHNFNICLTVDEGVLLIEPQDDAVWKPNIRDDRLLWVRLT